MGTGAGYIHTGERSWNVPAAIQVESSSGELRYPSHRCDLCDGHGCLRQDFIEQSRRRRHLYAVELTDQGNRRRRARLKQIRHENKCRSETRNWVSKSVLGIGLAV